MELGTPLVALVSMDVALDIKDVTPAPPLDVRFVSSELVITAGIAAMAADEVASEDESESGAARADRQARVVGDRGRVGQDRACRQNRGAAAVAVRTLENHRSLIVDGQRLGPRR